jgi:cyclase
MKPTKRIIPKILVQWDSARDRYVAITTVGYDSSRLVGSALSQAQIFESNGCDELMLINITANGPKTSFDRLIEEISESVFTPLAVGGSIHSLERAMRLIENGADKVVLGSAETLGGLGTAIADRLGSQAVIASLDYDETSRSMHADATISIESALEQVSKSDVGEVLLNSITRDGSRLGYDLETIRLASELLDIPVIAGTGCGSGQDVAAAISAGADAAAVGTLFAFSDQNPMQARAHVLNAGHHVRMNR